MWITTGAAWAEVAGAVVLDHARAQVASRLLVDEWVTLLVPVPANHRGGLGPAVHDGQALLFGAR